MPRFTILRCPWCGRRLAFVNADGDATLGRRAEVAKHDGHPYVRCARWRCRLRALFAEHELIDSGEPS